jgi:hypothetical protein
MAAVEPKSVPYDVDLSFRIRRINDRGSFHGLWALDITGADGHTEQLIDADMLSNVVARLSQTLENAGF